MSSDTLPPTGTRHAVFVFDPGATCRHSLAMPNFPNARTLVLSAAIMAAPAAAAPASAQGFIAVAFQQAFTSTDLLESPRGLSLSLGADRIRGPVGFSASYQRVSQGSGVVNQTCGFASCSVGPFDRSRSLETVDLGVSVRPEDGSLATVTVEANVSVSSQRDRLVHVDTGEVVNDDGPGSDIGFGLSTRVELPVARRLRPFLSARFDRILASTCDADASCFPSRNVTRLGVGLLWRP